MGVGFEPSNTDAGANHPVSGGLGCELGALRCDGSRLERCGDNGMGAGFELVDTCGTPALCGLSLDRGECSNGCAPGETRCAGGSVQRCNEGATGFDTVELCPAGCDDLARGCLPLQLSDAGGAPVCTPGAGPRRARCWSSGVPNDPGRAGLRQGNVKFLLRSARWQPGATLAPRGAERAPGAQPCATGDIVCHANNPALREQELRLLLIAKPDALSAVGRIFIQEIQRWQRQQARALGFDQAEGAAVSFCQRFGSSLNLNIHWHVIVPDALFLLAAKRRTRAHTCATVIVSTRNRAGLGRVLL